MAEPVHILWCLWLPTQDAVGGEPTNAACRDEDQVIEGLGYGSGRRRRASRRRPSSKKPVRCRQVPEEINSKIGEATMCYTLGR